MLNPDLDDFRFGIQKSRKTITDAMKDETVFTFDGVESLFKILRGNLDIQDKTKNASYVSTFLLVEKLLKKVSFHNIISKSNLFLIFALKINVKGPAFAFLM